MSIAIFHNQHTLNMFSLAHNSKEAFMAKRMNWQKVGKQEQIRRNGHQFKKDNSRHFHWPRGSTRAAQKCEAQNTSSFSPQIKSLIEDIVVRVFRSQGILSEHKVLPPNK
jgi:hypothetical protein